MGSPLGQRSARQSEPTPRSARQSEPLRRSDSTAGAGKAAASAKTTAWSIVERSFTRSSRSQKEEGEGEATVEEVSEVSPADMMAPDGDLPLPPPLPPPLLPPASGSSATGDAVSAAAKPGAKIRELLGGLEETEEALAARVAQLRAAAGRMREVSYTLREFHDDMVECFPELRLYLPADAAEAQKESMSGRTSEAEYKRTLGALFAVYWLMRLEFWSVPASKGARLLGSTARSECI